MKHFLIFLGVFWGVHFSLLAQTDNRKLSGFQAISVIGGFDVFLIPSSEEKIELIGDSQILPHIKTEIKGNTLFISLSKPELWYGKGEKDEIKINLYFKTLQSLVANASADIVGGKNKIESKNLELKVWAGSSIQASIESENLSCQLLSGSGLYLNGQTQNLQVENNEGSLLDALDLNSQKAVIIANSGSLSKIQVQKSLEVKASSGAVVKYTGNPQSQVQTEWGAIVTKN